MAIGLLLVVQAQQMQDCGVPVVGHPGERYTVVNGAERTVPPPFILGAS